jgi:hypothetical protein
LVLQATAEESRTVHTSRPLFSLIINHLSFILSFPAPVFLYISPSSQLPARGPTHQPHPIVTPTYPIPPRNASLLLLFPRRPSLSFLCSTPSAPAGVKGKLQRRTMDSARALWQATALRILRRQAWRPQRRSRVPGRAWRSWWRSRVPQQAWRSRQRSSRPASSSHRRASASAERRSSAASLLPARPAPCSLRPSVPCTCHGALGEQGDGEARTALRPLRRPRWPPLHITPCIASPAHRPGWCGSGRSSPACSFAGSCASC